MIDSPICANCGQQIEPGAVFCGNCGQALQVALQPPTSPLLGITPLLEATVAPLPAYAVANPASQKGETKAMTGLVISILAVPAAIIPFLGMAMGITGLVLGTLSRITIRKTVNNLAISFSCLAILASIAMFVYNISNYNSQQAAKLDQTNLDTTNQSLAVGNNTDTKAVGSGSRRAVDTVCYKASLEKLSIFNNVAGSCAFRTYDDESLAAATKLFTVDAANEADITEANFAGIAKDLIAKTFKSNLPTFTITDEKASTFANSPGYLVSGKDNGDGFIQMAIVLHPVAHGENIFVMVHAVNDMEANVGLLEKGWVWK